MNNAVTPKGKGARKIGKREGQQAKHLVAEGISHWQRDRLVDHDCADHNVAELAFSWIIQQLAAYQYAFRAFRVHWSLAGYSKHRTLTPMAGHAVFWLGCCALASDDHRYVGFYLDTAGNCRRCGFERMAGAWGAWHICSDQYF